MAEHDEALQARPRGERQHEFDGAQFDLFECGLARNIQLSSSLIIKAYLQIFDLL